MKTWRLSLVALVGVVALVAGGQAAKADANTAPIGAAYNNRLMDDGIFTRANSMSAIDIQNFLNARVPTCLPIGGASDSTNPHGRPDLRMPCLKSYVDPSTGRSAAQMIYDIAQARGLSPAVLLTTLEKEQSLVTDTWPYRVQYNTAIGYGCPDGGNCNADYYGLANQLNLGATLLRVGLDRNCGNTSSYPGWSFPSQYRLGNTPSIDGRPTNIQTCATGALYGYTPHRPDSAWLRAANDNNYYYGNYNFITIYQRWFGAVWTDPYHAQYAGQTTTPAIVQGQQRDVSMAFVNTGGGNWNQSNVFLGTSNPLNRASGFYAAGAAGWLSPSRVRMVETSVAPGQTAHFTFTLTANPAAGSYNEYFRPVVEGVTWMEDYGAFFPVTVAGGQYGATLVDQSGADMLDANRQGTVTMHYRNTGTIPWVRDTFHLGTTAPHDHVSGLYAAGAAGWLSNTRVALQENSVAPGQVGTFVFTAIAPQTGRFSDQFAPLIEGVAWLDSAATQLNVETGGSYAAQYAGQSANPGILTGQTAPMYVDMKNVGTATWYNDGVHAVKLGTDNAQDRASAAANATWLSASRIKMDQAVVAPGQTARFSFTVNGPAAGIYNEYVRPVAEGRTWFGNSNYVYFHLDTVPRTSAAFAGESFPTSLTRGVGQTAWIQFLNTGNTTWQKTGATPFRLGTSHPMDRGSGFATIGSGWISSSRIALDQDSVAPGQVGRFTFQLTAPNGVPSGTYPEYFQPVLESVAWMQDWGVYLPLNVQ